jgi:hypothetical protein
MSTATTVTTSIHPQYSMLTRQIRTDQFWLHFCAIATSITIGGFIIKLFVGGNLSGTWSPEQWISVLVAVMITIVIAAAKDRLYQSNRVGTSIIFGTAIMIGFGYFGETSQTMEREDATVKQRSESSPVFRASLAKIQELGKNTGSGKLENLIIEAAVKLAKKRTALSQCNHYQGPQSRTACRMPLQQDIAGLKAQINEYQRLRESTVVEHQVADQKFITQIHGMEFDTNQHYAMVRAIRDFCGVSFDTASMLFALVIVTAFEFGHWFFGRSVKEHRAEIAKLQAQMPVQQAESMRPTLTAPACTIQAGSGLNEVEKRSEIPSRANATPTCTIQAGSGLNEVEKRSEIPSHTNATPACTIQAGSGLNDDVFDKLKQMVLTHQVIPQYRPIMAVLKNFGIGSSNVIRQKLAASALNKMKNEGILTLNNPDGNNGRISAKYILLS